MTAAERAERLGPWFELQLRFAEQFASRAQLPLTMAITFYTNLHRRFGFGRPSADVQAPEWNDFAEGLAAKQTLDARLAFTQSFARTRLGTWRAATDREFGCFGFDAPNGGVVRIHFHPNDNDGGVGPLSHTKYARRIGELAEMFAFIRRKYGADTQHVAGGSWLYNREAYRRLFPPAYIESLAIHTRSSNLSGGSWWGQFLGHDERLVAAAARQLSANLAHLDVAQAWRVFPLPALTATAEIDVFHEHYTALARQPEWSVS
jgi:hypothetical protein